MTGRCSGSVIIAAGQAQQVAPIKRINAAAKEIPVGVLREALRLDGETGRLFWRVRPVAHFEGRSNRGAEGDAKRWNAKYAGKEAFTASDPRGYRRGEINQTPLWAHRVVYAIHNGIWPPEEVDHINGDKSDNRPHNLRSVSHAQNRRNTQDALRIGACVYRTKNARWRVSRNKEHRGVFDCFGIALKESRR